MLFLLACKSVSRKKTLGFVAVLASCGDFIPAKIETPKGEKDMSAF